ncbi:MAG: hypothetical protein HRT89_02425 [Lentisphaeria bacterium]|nr:hypothetical protein [Lentisphaeria bacterium]
MWRHFSEQQHGVRIKKAGSKEDFFTVLYPRTGKEKAAKVTTLAKGKAVKVEHSEGTDIVLLSPTSDIKTSLDDTRLEGRIAFARSYTDGRQRLAVIKGKDALVRSGDWELKSSGPTAINIKGKHVTGESSGNAHTVQLTLPADYGAAKIIVDGQAAKGKREGHVLTFKLPSGNKTFSVNPQ